MFKNLLESYRNKIEKGYRKFRSGIHNRSVIRRWNKAGRPYPSPHEYKQEIIKKYRERYNLDTLIEAGTFLGDMVSALQDSFLKIFSIELNIDHYLNAKEKFYLLEHVEIIKGESGEQISILLRDINKPALFWLDAHAWLEKGLSNFSILEEIKSILAAKPQHVILINDARLFTGESGYPFLIGLRNYIAELRPEYQFEVEDDIIRVVGTLN